MKPDTPELDNQQLLKRRARRRLIGAAFFVILVAGLLPLVMDATPPQQLNEFRIVTEEEKRAEAMAQPPMPLPPPEVVPASAMPATPGVIKEAASEDKPEAPKEAVPPVVVSAPVEAPATVAKVIETPAKVEKVAEVKKAPEKPLEKAPEKTVDKKPVDKKTVEKPVEKKPADKPVDKAVDKKDAKDQVQSGQYFIQVGVFADADNVKQVRQKLNAQGLSSWTEVATGNLAGKTRVKAGPFANREAADKALAKITKAGLNGLVVKK